jgi:hypothetical protein
MENNKVVLGFLALVAIGALVLAGIAVGRPVTVTVQNPVGTGGSQYSAVQYLYDGAFIPSIRDKDDTVLSTSSTNSVKTLTSKDLCENPVIHVYLKTATGTITLPTAASMIAGDCLNRQGSRMVFTLQNSSSSGVWDLAGNTSSTLLTLKIASTTLTGEGFYYGTSTVAAKSIAKVTGHLTVSSTIPWVYWLVEIFGVTP